MSRRPHYDFLLGEMKLCGLVACFEEGLSAAGRTEAWRRIEEAGRKCESSVRVDERIFSPEWAREQVANTILETMIAVCAAPPAKVGALCRVEIRRRIAACVAGLGGLPALAEARFAATIEQVVSVLEKRGTGAHGKSLFEHMLDVALPAALASLGAPMARIKKVARKLPAIFKKGGHHAIEPALRAALEPLLPSLPPEAWRALGRTLGRELVRELRLAARAPAAMRCAFLAAQAARARGATWAAIREAAKAALLVRLGKLRPEAARIVVEHVGALLKEPIERHLRFLDANRTAEPSQDSIETACEALVELLATAQQAERVALITGADSFAPHLVLLTGADFCQQVSIALKASLMPRLCEWVRGGLKRGDAGRAPGISPEVFDAIEEDCVADADPARADRWCVPFAQTRTKWAFWKIMARDYDWLEPDTHWLAVGIAEIEFLLGESASADRIAAALREELRLRYAAVCRGLGRVPTRRDLRDSFLPNLFRWAPALTCDPVDAATWERLLEKVITPWRVEDILAQVRRRDAGSVDDQPTHLHPPDDTSAPLVQLGRTADRLLKQIARKIFRLEGRSSAFTRVRIRILSYLFLSKSYAEMSRLLSRTEDAVRQAKKHAARAFLRWAAPFISELEMTALKRVLDGLNTPRGDRLRLISALRKLLAALDRLT